MINTIVKSTYQRSIHVECTAYDKFVRIDTACAVEAEIAQIFNFLVGYLDY